MKKRNLFISILLYLPILLMGQNVLSVNDMEVDAYTNDIALSFNLENLTNEVGGLQFDLNQDIDLLSVFAAEGVGRATTSTVVVSCVSILILDYFLAEILLWLK